MDEERNALRSVHWDFGQAIGNGPTARGFDTYFGVDLPNYPPFTFIEQDRVQPLPTATYNSTVKNPFFVGAIWDGTPMAPGWKFDEVLPEITRRAVRYVEEHAKSDSPFFLYFAMTSPHEPVAPSAAFRGKSGIAPIADFVMETDWAAGQVIDAIDKAGIAEDTVVIFTADNGHSSYTGMDVLAKAGHKVSGPYRGAKGDIWEGGHRVPFVVRWPGRVTAGSSSDRLVCLNDVFATLADVITQKLPDDAAEDSFSFLSTLEGESDSNSGAEARTSVVHHSLHGEFAYREGVWKLVLKMPERDLPSSRGKATVVELYNLEGDIGERTNLASEHAEIVERLEKNLAAIVARGRSRSGRPARNDAAVRFDVIQTERWAPPLN
jgi:arylsulfatase A-like enzyme